MLEIFLNFEQMAIHFSPDVLIGTGLAALITGLFVWLGGMGFRKILAAVTGAITGGVCAFFITGRNLAVTGISAALTALAAIVLERFFIAVLTAVFVAAITLFILAEPTLEKSHKASSVFHGEIKNRDEKLTAAQTAEMMRRYAADSGDEIKRITAKMPLQNWAILVGLSVIFIIAGFFFKRIAAALCFATLGTILTFAGMILLLLYKGAVPVSCIIGKLPYYTTVLAGMTAFGTVEQLLLCRYASKKPAAGKMRNSNEDQTSQDWRNK